MREGRRGRFITLEGTEGVGKTSQVEAVAALVRAAGPEVLVTREPGGTPLGEGIRRLVLDPAAGEVPPLAELLLMFAARAAHVATVIEPALAGGRWVVCDRFVDASYAYQGGGRGLPGGTIATLERLVLGDLRPDLTLFLDAPLEVARARQQARGGPDRFEGEGMAFFERVRRAYLDRAAGEPDRIRVIDAAGDLASVTAMIGEHLRRFLRENL